MKKIKYLFVGIISICLLFYVYEVVSPPTVPKEKVAEALAFCKKNNLSTEYAVFVDFGKHSGRKRYMVYDFHKNEIVYRCMCIGGSNLSSQGKYRIHPSKLLMRDREWFAIYGLEDTNSNARDQGIYIYDSEALNFCPSSTFPIPILIGDVSDEHFSITSEGVQVIRKSPKPMLLWAYQ